MVDDIKWCESWEKNFDSTFKAISKFKDDVKQKPSNLSTKTQNRVKTYLDLLIMELDEINDQFNIKKEDNAME